MYCAFGSSEQRQSPEQAREETGMASVTQLKVDNAAFAVSYIHFKANGIGQRHVPTKITGNLRDGLRLPECTPADYWSRFG